MQRTNCETTTKNQRKIWFDRRYAYSEFCCIYWESLYVEMFPLITKSELNPKHFDRLKKLNMLKCRMIKIIYHLNLESQAGTS